MGTSRGADRNRSSTRTPRCRRQRRVPHPKLPTENYRFRLHVSSAAVRRLQPLKGEAVGVIDPLELRSSSGTDDRQKLSSRTKRRSRVDAGPTSPPDAEFRVGPLTKTGCDHACHGEPGGAGGNAASPTRNFPTENCRFRLHVSSAAVRRLQPLKGGGRMGVYAPVSGGC